ncbi:MAG: DNA sulfur modification protein DndD [Nitrososphaerota archaeon]|nr:DNA sulfur modification protein DndD [Nitrososphaerota archaeon]MDG7049130.1 DNA sulfur modification protein DndD [Nitrososphaerota archaeon]MDG7052076.1 DNA sulfur modification protein DndD [Nitrososphaerota archaeon]
MLFKTLTVENFGIFKGKHTFDFSTGNTDLKDRPLIIIGGRNGSGKTTLFEGIKLCLYGSYFRGMRMTRQRYEYYLESMVHKQGGLAESEGSSVSIGIEHSHLGNLSRYIIRRSWNASMPVREKLEIIKDGKPLEGIGDNQLQDFLIELIPIGLSNLFFFDGEQIQRLANDEQNNKHLIEAFDSLLGLDIVQHLKTDLKIHMGRQTRVKSDSIEQELNVLTKDKKELIMEIEKLWQRKAQLQTENDRINSEIERAERRIAMEGGGYAIRRDELKAKRAVLEAQIPQLEERIREIASSLLPFAIVPSLCDDVNNRLKVEEELQQKAAARELLHKAISEFGEKLGKADFWVDLQIDAVSKALITSKAIETVKQVTLVQDTDQEKGIILHQISALDRQKIENWIDQSINWVPAELKGLTEHLEENIRDLAEVESTLSRVPPEEVISPLVRELNNLYKEREANAKQMGAMEEKISQTDYKLKNVERQLEKRFDEQEQLEAMKARVELEKKTQAALSEYASTLRKEKIKAISDQFVITFNQLSSKKNLLHHMHIDDTNFNITLFRMNGSTISKEELSAGEKQIYATAMLVTLAKISDRPIPFIIDTPLSRLDSEHRAKLAQAFFPNVSHQVIIFSTDTEIDRHYIDVLRPFVSRSYILNYDESGGYTQITAGYFWEERGDNI